MTIGLVVERPGALQPEPVTVHAMVDSGAFRSLFPLRVAADLGIQPGELTEDPRGGMGVGAPFRFWATNLAIRAGIAFFEPAPNGTERPWEGFNLNPVFTEHDAFLLGRQDFFRTFRATFELTADGPAFHLDN